MTKRGAINFARKETVTSYFQMKLKVRPQVDTGQDSNVEETRQMLG